jgi:hypothetical protein
VTKQGPPTLSPRAQRIFVLGFLIFFIGSLIGVSIWSFTVTQSVRDQARSTDEALRSAAWVILSLSVEHGGFPATSDDLVGRPVPERLPEAFAAASEALPASRTLALLGRPLLPIGEALDVLEVTWSEDPSMPPVLATDGRPSELGTLDIVNGWMVVAAEVFAQGG